MRATRQSGGDLGRFLRDHRTRLPAPEGASRRRTPGLRREEVAARAAVSVTWYTWLEQGRGGPPSAEALERIAGALDLKPEARELLFLLAQQRPPPVRQAPAPEVPGAVQAVLEAMPCSPAFVKTAAWDIVAWNAAAQAALGAFDASSERPPNGLKRIFLDPLAKETMPHWEDHARFAVAVFRVDLARAGGDLAAEAVLAELQAGSADFRRLWARNEAGGHKAGLKRLRLHSGATITVHMAAFGVAGAEGLTMIVYHPATVADKAVVDGLLQATARAA